LAAHKYRVQEEIEKILRQSHGGDFEDPDLKDIKRQIRDQINEVLGGHIVSDIIVTNLKLTRANKIVVENKTNKVESPDWLEKTSHVTEE
jgi:hypothetical protein